MEIFPIVRRKDIQKYGNYRTKLVILEIYDKMKTAMETGRSYQTILDPLPGSPKKDEGQVFILHIVSKN